MRARNSSTRESSSRVGDPLGTVAVRRNGALSTMYPIDWSWNVIARAARVVGVDYETRRLQVGPGLLAEPANDGHTRVFPVVVDEVLPSQIMVEVNLIPGFAESDDAVSSRFDPDGVGVLGQEIKARFASSSRNRMRRPTDKFASNRWFKKT